MTDAMVSGAIFGLAAYATYALTNHAVMRGWTPLMTVADMGWGTILGALGSASGLFVARYLSR